MPFSINKHILQAIPMPVPVLQGRHLLIIINIGPRKSIVEGPSDLITHQVVAENHKYDIPEDNLN